MNLKNETLEMLEKHGKTPEDIVRICGDVFEITPDSFWEKADVEYDEGYGGAEVARDLIIIGDGFVMYRHEYDGAEEWRWIDLRPRNRVETDYCLTQCSSLTVRE